MIWNNFFKNKTLKQIWIFISRRNIAFYFLLGIASYFLIGKVHFLNKINIYHLERPREDMFKADIESVVGKNLAVHNLKSGIVYFKAIMNLTEPLASTYGNLGFCYYYLNDYSKAIVVYGEAIKRDPLRYIYWWDQGMIYFKLKDYKKAIFYIKKAVELIPDTSRYYIDTAKSFPILRWQAQILELIPFALERALNDMQIAYLVLAQCYCNVGQIDDAQNAISSGLLIASKRSNSFYLKNFEYFLKHGKEGSIFFPGLKPELHFDYSFNRTQVAIKVLDKVIAEKQGLTKQD